MPYGRTKFKRLNRGWNADPNAPHPMALAEGDDVVLAFGLNHFLYKSFEADDMGTIRFHNCVRYRFNNVNDEGWYRGRCRFSGLAPDWGEFYEVEGDFLEMEPGEEWTELTPPTENSRNFLFYFKDNAFECSAEDWSFDHRDWNALNRLSIENRADLDIGIGTDSITPSQRRAGNNWLHRILLAVFKRTR